MPPQLNLLYTLRHGHTLQHVMVPQQPQLRLLAAAGGAKQPHATQLPERCWRSLALTHAASTDTTHRAAATPHTGTWLQLVR